METHQMNWTPETFTAHVGASNFHEAIDVLLGTKASDEDTIAAQFLKIKRLAATATAMRESLEKAMNCHLEICPECSGPDDGCAVGEHLEIAIHASHRRHENW